jgi:CheY-like chemotaxis protein
LVVNAAEALSSNGVITIRLAQDCWERVAVLDGAIGNVSYSGTCVRLDVIDNGCGMDSPTKSRIFDPFFSTKFTGRGLGLPAAFGIIRSHRGVIQVDSQLSCGTHISVWLPIARVEQKSDEIEEHPAEVVPWKGTGRVLVVDDESQVRNMAIKIVERCGLSAVAASDGLEAIRLFADQSGKFDCVLLDLTMPHMDGEKTLDELRKIRADVPVIICSGYSVQEVSKRFQGKKVEFFLTKPFDIDSLTQAIRAVV